MEMNQRLFRQIQRLNELHSLVYEGKDTKDFLSQRIGRSPSSLEEDLVSQLSLFDEAEEQEIAQEASKIIGGKKFITDPKDFELIMKTNSELGKKVKAIGLKNHQHMIQDQFYDKIKGILALSKPYEFPARYESVTHIDFMGIDATCLEQYDYGGSLSYRSMFYHLMRHLNNVPDEESQSEIEDLAKRTFSGKRILELGSGPGFFLYALRELGADVTGIDINDKFREQANQARLNILYGDSRDLTRLVRDRQFDIIFSKDFLSLGVTRHDAEPIMQGVFSALKDGGLTVHQVEYKKRSEEKYLVVVEEFCKSQGNDFSRMKEVWSKLNNEQKEYMLRSNIFNISLDHLKDLGYKPFTTYRLDADEFLTITLSK